MQKCFTGICCGIICQHPHALPLQALLIKHNTVYCDCKQCSSVSTTTWSTAKKIAMLKKWIKQKFRAIGAFNGGWKCLQLDQSWQSRMNHCHDQNSCIHHLCQHIVWEKEQVLKDTALPWTNWPPFQCSLLSTLKFLHIRNIQQECNTTKLAAQRFSISEK